MEDSEKLSNTTNFSFLGRQSWNGGKSSLLPTSEGSNMHHHHSASLDDLLAEEQPVWLDDLLSDSSSPSIRKCHRRSASDTTAYLNSTLMPFKEDDLLRNHNAGPSWLFQNIDHRDELWQSNSYDKQDKLGWEMSMMNGANRQTPMVCRGVNNVGTPASKSGEKQVAKMNGTKVDGPASKTDSKRIKNQNAHRARLRRLQYISDLERAVQVLQAEGNEMSFAIQYFDQQLLMLSMENRALKQRMDSLAEIQKLKHVEQQYLEKEIGNLQFLRHQKQQQQQKKQMPQNLHNKFHQPTTQELDSQLAALTI